LARQIWVSISDNKPEEFLEKKSALRLLIAFAIALKLHLRQEKINSEIEQFVLPYQYEILQKNEQYPARNCFLDCRLLDPTAQ